MSDPQTPLDLEVAAAVDLFRRGEPAAAEARCRAVLARARRHRDARVLLGLLLHFAERYAQAEAIFTELTRDEPHEGSHWANLGAARRGAKRFEEALQAYARAMQLGIPSADLLYNVGLTHLDRLDFEAARAILARAITLAPEDAEIRYRHAFACFSSLQTDEALQSLTGWEHLSGLTPELLADIGLLLMNLGDSIAAEAALQHAALDPAPSPRTALTLVHAYERTNRMAQSRAHLQQLRADPRAHTLGEELPVTEARIAERAGEHERAAQLLQAALRKVPELHLRHFQLFSLAKSLDALGRHDEAFATLVEAHQSQIAFLRLSAPTAVLRDTPVMAATQLGVDAADVARWDTAAQPATADSPVFVVGFPRSGTTLLELTLDAHPLLVSMDEQPFLQGALRDILAIAPYPHGLAALTATDLERVRAAYWQRVRRRVQLAPGQRLVDKNPLNILRLPVIQRLFPNARILLAVRHPCDVLFSCYMQHFRAPEFALLCADLGTLAVGYRRAFDFWYREAAVLQPAVREVRYETLVVDFEAQVRAIADFLELPWDQRMLAPAAHAQAKGFISTPSYSQVVEPVNKRSVGRWHAYRAYFEAVLPRLASFLARWDYEA